MKKGSRSRVHVEESHRWVFNQMAEDYDARPPYPRTLIDALTAWGTTAGPRVCDLGAGTGQLTLPLASHGFAVTAVEPALSMLEQLRRNAAERSIDVRLLHAAAESVPVEPASFDWALIADALHFIDAEAAARELARILVVRGRLAVITCEFTPTPFMREVIGLMQASAPRRPRNVVARRAQLFGVGKFLSVEETRFFDQTPVDPEALERILATISFIGPAMNEHRAAVFRERLRAIAHPPIWARTFTLHTARRGLAQPSPPRSRGTRTR
ncbi:MAG: class I SAM-dependent methyltransferase [Polyangiaceae bacterium]